MSTQYFDSHAHCDYSETTKGEPRNQLMTTTLIIIMIWKSCSTTRCATIWRFDLIVSFSIATYIYINQLLKGGCSSFQQFSDTMGTYNTESWDADNTALVATVSVVSTLINLMLTCSRFPTFVSLKVWVRTRVVVKLVFAIRRQCMLHEATLNKSS